MRRLISFFGFGTILLLAISTTKALAIETFLAAVNGTDKISELGEIRPGWALPVAGGNVSVPECAVSFHVIYRGLGEKGDKWATP